MDDSTTLAQTIDLSRPARLGRYRVLKPLGKGAFGQVYLAQDEQMMRQVAIKVAHPRPDPRPEDDELFLKEGRVLASLEHPGIVPVYDCGRSDDGLRYLVSKYIEGSDLAAVIRNARPGHAESAGLVAQIADALHYAHLKDIVHRDVKPANILLDRSGKPYVVDFGLARTADLVGEGMHLVGTPLYMSPEQARGDGDRVDARSDIFSLGLLFYELLVGKPLFTARTLTELLSQVVCADIRPPRTRDDSIPKELERVCLKALSKRVSDRYTTARDFADDLRAALAGPVSLSTTEASLPAYLSAGTVTLLFTDIVSSSRIKCLLPGTESERNAQWLSRFQDPHHELVRRCLREQQGVEIKTMGDAFFVTFDDPARAVACAVLIQRGLEAAKLPTPLPGGRPLAVRIGIHTGQAEKMRSGDYVGTAVDKAARIEAAAAGGQILLSEQTAALVRDQLPAWEFRPRGAVELPGLGRHNLVEVLWDEEPEAAESDVLVRTPRASAGAVIGGFELRGRIGSGGMGVVYRAWQPSEAREVALKCLHLGDATARNRFLVEIRALGKVEHPHLVRIYTSGADDHQSYFAMELIDGANFKALYRHLGQSTAGDLDDPTWREVVGVAADETRSREQPVGRTVASGTPHPADSPEPVDYLESAPAGILESDSYTRRVVAIVRDITTATQALHEKGVIHRDIKPENIMVTRDGGRAVLMDLGIAKLTQESDNGLTRTREFVGSLRYASPEQVLAAREVDHRSDVYSLGATLWELLTLRPLYGIRGHVGDAKAMLKIEIEEPEPVRKYNRRVSADLQAVVQKCLEKNPERRYQSAAALAEDLERALQGQPVQARRVGPLSRLWRRCRRRPAVPGLTAALVLLAVVLAGILVPWPTTRLRLGIKPWVGFAPLIVAAKMHLCGDTHLEFVPAENIDIARTLLTEGSIDGAMWLVDSHVHTRSRNMRTKVVLKLDDSLGADAVVAHPGITSFADLKGKKVAYEYLDAPHFLFLTLCERHNLRPGDVHLIRKSAKEAAQAFIDGEVDAAVTYDPFLQATLDEGTILATSADVPGTIVDVLTIHEDYLRANPERVKDLIRGWFTAVDLLERGDPEALRIACEFLGKDGVPLTPEGYRKMTEGMRYAKLQDNLKFFQVHADGSSEFRDLMAAAQERWAQFGQLGRRTEPADGDGSALLLEMYGLCRCPEPAGTQAQVTALGSR